MKDFIIIIPKGAVTYNEIFPLLVNHKAYIGYTRPDFNNLTGLCRWLSTYSTNKPSLKLTKTYNDMDYPKYDNYNAIEVGKIKDIPYDYDKPMGVPITIFDWDISDYTIKGILKGEFSNIDDITIGHQPKVNGKDKFSRIVIRKI